MSVTAAQGFRAAGVAAGLRRDGGRDVALVINDGPGDAVAAVFTGPDPANPELWSERVVADGRARAVVLNSGAANRGTGPEGFQLTHATAELVAELAGISAFDVLVASTGPDRPIPDRERLLAGVRAAHTALRTDGGDDAAQAAGNPGPAAQAVHRSASGWTIGGLAEGGAGLLVITTDADVDPAGLDAALRGATQPVGPSDVVTSDVGPRGAGRTVALLASAAGVTPDPAEFAEALRQVVLALDGQSAATENTPAESKNSVPAS